MTLSNTTRKEDMPELALESSGLTIRSSVGMPFVPRNPKSIIADKSVLRKPNLYFSGKSGSVKRRANVAQQKKAMDTVKQLRKEVGLKRLPVSVAVKDIITFVGHHSSQDFLLGGGNDFKKTNPFREKALPTVLCLPLPFSRNRRRSFTM